MIKNGSISYVLDQSPKQLQVWHLLSDFWLLITALVQTPEAADCILPKGLELHQSKMCCHLHVIVPQQS